MYRSEIKDGKLILTAREIPEDMVEERRVFSDWDCIDGISEEFNLRSLKDDFPVVDSVRGIMSLIRNSPLNTNDSFSMLNVLQVADMDVDDIYDRTSGYVKIAGLQYGIPLEFFKEFVTSCDDMISKSREFGHNLLTQAVEKGEVMDDTIRVVYEGDLPPGAGEEIRNMYVMKTRVLIDPSVVERIEDKGAYRSIYLKEGVFGEHAAFFPIHTVESVEALQKMFGLDNDARQGFDAPGPG